MTEVTRTVDTENLTDKIYPDFGHNVAADPRNIEKNTVWVPLY